jgi:hypothetical protein
MYLIQVLTRLSQLEAEPVEWEVWQTDVTVLRRKLPEYCHLEPDFSDVELRSDVDPDYLWLIWFLESEYKNDGRSTNNVLVSV